MNLSQSTDNVLSNTDKFVFRTNHIIGNGSVQIACVCQTQDCKKEVIFFGELEDLNGCELLTKLLNTFSL